MVLIFGDLRIIFLTNLIKNVNVFAVLNVFTVLIRLRGLCLTGGLTDIIFTFFWHHTSMILVLIIILWWQKCEKRPH